jgi:predicted nucleic acid-binding protein
MKRYADTSYLFSYYGSDAHSTRADAWRQANAVPLPLTPLHRLELRNALELAVFQNRLGAIEAREVWLTVESDLKAGQLAGQDLSLTSLFQEAESLAANHTAQTGARSLDILHIAAAKLLGMEEFVTLDQRQAALAARVGLKLATL